MQLLNGMRLRSAACEAEVIVMRAPQSEVRLECGGVQMLMPGQERAPVQPSSENAGATQLSIGKRYVDADTGLEVLCARASKNGLTVDSRPLTLLAPKQLPASD